MKTPAEVYTSHNLRPYRERPPEWEYSGGEIIRIDSKGGFNKYGYWHFVCEALAHERVRLDEFDGRLIVTFRHLTIREINLRTRTNTRVLLQSKVNNLDKAKTKVSTMS